MSARTGDGRPRAAQTGAMAINCTVTVIDANGAAISGAQVAVGTQRGVTDPAGRFATTVADPATAGVIDVRHPYYVTEIQAYAGDLRTEPGSNPLVTRTVTGQDVALTVRLGRAETVPGREFTDDETKKILKTKDADA